MPRSAITLGGLSFNGDSSYLDLGTLGNLGSQLGNGFYCKFDIKTTSTRASYLGNRREGFTSIRIGFNLERNFGTASGQLVIVAIDNSNNILTVSTQSSCNFNDGNRHTIEFAINFATRTVILKVDGVVKPVWPSNNDVLNNFSNFSRAFYIGARNDDGTPNNFMNAIIYDFQIGTSINNIYGNYGFTENTGIVANDVSGNNNTATLKTVSLAKPLPNWAGRQIASNRSVVTDRFLLRDFGKSLSFNGSNHYAEVPITPDVNGFSFGLWVKDGVSGNFGRFLMWGAPAPVSNGFEFMKNANQYNLFIYNNNTTQVNVARKYAPGNYDHVVFTFKPNELKMYVNSVLVATDTSCSMGVPSSGITMTIGRRADTPGSYFKGSLDDFVFQNTANTPWTQEQINDLYYKGKVPQGASYYNFNDNVNDQSEINGPLTLFGPTYATDVPLTARSSA